MQTDFDTHDKDKNLDENGQPKQAADHDTMGGEILLDCLSGGILGAAFTEALEAPEWVQSIEWDKAAELYDEFRRDRTDGGFQLGVQGSLLPAFNAFGSGMAGGIAMHTLAASDSPSSKAGNDNIYEPSNEDPAVAQFFGRGSYITAARL
jgi:hypothetical protein